VAKEILGSVGALIALGASLYYIYHIIKGSTRPQRITWGVWALAALLGFATAKAGGAGPGVYVIAVYVFLTSIVFILSLFPKYGKPDREQYDFLVGFLAVSGIIAWKFFNLPLDFAAAVAVIADALALWPTLRGTWRQPDSEPIQVWAADAVAALFGVIAVTEKNFASMAFPVYLALGQTLIVIILLRRNLSKSHHRSSS